MSVNIPAIAIVGNPNSGKTTAFNAYTGAKQHIANYPGITVTTKEGIAYVDEQAIRIIDLPGIYSIDSWSEEEKVARDLILNEKPDAVIHLVNASALDRHLYLTLQLLDMGLNVVLGVNMMDEATAQGIHIDLNKLEQELGIPVVATIARKNIGLEELLRKALRVAGPSEHISINIPDEDKVEEIASARYKHIDAMLKDVVSRDAGNIKDLNNTDRIDKILTHHIFGPLLMLAVIYVVYVITFSLGQIPMDMVENMFSFIRNQLDAVMPEGLLKSLVLSGIIDGVGGIVTFVPLIFIMFLQISVLEDSGYMARMAYMLDRIFRVFGLHGSSVMPFIVGGGIAGGCAVPAILATRALAGPLERLATLLTVSFMACGAKLPIFILFVSVFFPHDQALVMFGLTLLGWAIALVSAKILRSTIIYGESTPFLMEMPPYRMPTVQNVLMQSSTKAWEYLKKAGTIILAISILVWAGMNFPRLPEEATAAYTQEERQSAELRHSLAGKIGIALETVTAPLGFDWRANVALIGGFAAKEVIVSTLGTAYSLGEVDAEEAEPLAEKISQDKNWNTATAMAFMVFVLLYAPCLVTLATMRQETGSWAWPAFSLIGNTVLAYGAALATKYVVLMF